MSKRNGVEKGEIQCKRKKNMSIVVSLVLSGCLVHPSSAVDLDVSSFHMYPVLMCVCACVLKREKQASFAVLMFCSKNIRSDRWLGGEREGERENKREMKISCCFDLISIRSVACQNASSFIS